MKIATAREIFGVKSHDDQHQWMLSLPSVKQRMRQVGIQSVGTPDKADTTAAKAVAYVNHGRWVADCPSPYCRNAMVVLPGAPFMCAVCLNGDIGYQYRMVEWPRERSEIEEILAARPVPEVANWSPGESIDSLRAENAAFSEGILR